MIEEADRSKDILGRVSEYFLGGFRRRRGQAWRGVLYAALGGPTAGRDARAKQRTGLGSLLRNLAACSSGPRNSLRSNGGRIGNIAIYGRESNYTTWRLAKMNVAVRGIDADIRWNNEGSFHKDELKDLKANLILANPGFNVSDWGRDRPRDYSKATVLGDVVNGLLDHAAHVLTAQRRT